MKPKRHIRIPLWWPDMPGNWRTWLPSRGNVVFTLLIIIGLLWAQSAGALPLGTPTAATTSIGTIAYQGRLADSDGTPLTDTVNMAFRLYDAASGGTPLWEELWTGSNAVQVSDGLFNVMLGSLNSIPQNIIAENDQLFLGITVGTDDEMTPRVQLGSVPFAVQALTVPDGSVTVDQTNVIANPIYSIGDTEVSVAATGYVDLMSINVNPSEAATLRIHFRSLVWKTEAGGRTALAVRIDGDPNSNPNNSSFVQVGTPVSTSWTGNSLYLSSTYFANVPAGEHTVTLVLGSWDGGTSHARAYGMSIETLQQP